MTPTTGLKKLIVKGEHVTLLEDYALINKHDRAGRDGKNIKCPHCESIERIYGLAWKTLTCRSCHTDVPKYEWMIDQLDTWRTPR